MRSLENHLVGVTTDKPHPDSYRPDLPLNGERGDDEGGYSDGYDDGYTCGNELGERAARRKAERTVA